LFGDLCQDKALPSEYSGISNASQSTAAMSEAPKKSDGPVACKICGVEMKNNAALGGHTSKAHPKESSAFALKMKRREERVIEREKL
jgi:hypothetical protein